MKHFKQTISMTLLICFGHAYAGNCIFSEGKAAAAADGEGVGRSNYAYKSLPGKIFIASQTLEHGLCTRDTKLVLDPQLSNLGIVTGKLYRDSSTCRKNIDDQRYTMAVEITKFYLGKDVFKYKLEAVGLEGYVHDDTSSTTTDMSGATRSDYICMLPAGRIQTEEGELVLSPAN